MDESIKSAPRVEEPFKPDAVLARHANAGVTKKKPTAKKLTRSQRLRRQKGIERAEKVLDRLEVKIKKSEGKAKKVNARKVDYLFILRLLLAMMLIRATGEMGGYHC